MSTPNSQPTVALVASRIRVEEKLLLESYAALGANVVRVDERDIALCIDRLDVNALHAALGGADAVHDRGIAFGTSLHLGCVLAAAGVVCVNDEHVVRTCGDKARTTIALAAAGVPQPPTRLCFSSEQALAILDNDLGYPAVVKPVVGSWGRLVARLNDRHAAEAVFEDRETLGDWTHRSIYLQRYVAKPGRDVRVFVVGDEPIAAVFRTSEHWITNTARGGRTSRAPHDGLFGDVALAAARAVGGGIVAVDVVEDPHEGPLVLEVNHGMEFRNSIEPTGVDIPGAMASYVLRRALAARQRREQIEAALFIGAEQ